MPDKGEKKGELPPEVDKYLSALVKDPRSKAFVPLADIYRKAGMLDEAIQVAKDGLKHNPNYLSGRFVLGRCYFEKGLLPEAEEELRRVVKVNPENVDAQKILAMILEKKGDNDNAIKTWDIVLTLAPNDPEAKQRMAVLKANIKKEESPHPEPVPPEVTVHKEPVSCEIPAKPAGEEIIQNSAGGEQVVTEDTVKQEESRSAEQTVEQPPVPPVEQSTEGITERKEEVVKKTIEQMVEEKESVSSVSLTGGMKEEKQDATIKSTSRMDAKEEIRDEQKEGMSTRELAELYVKQGFLDRALKIYRELEESNPDDMELKKRIEFIVAELDKKKKPETEVSSFKENIKTLSSWLEKIKRGG